MLSSTIKHFIPSDLSIKNAHCWHTEKTFSKFKFGTGKYDSQDFSNMSDMATTRDYITAVAISSIRLSNEELKNISTSDSLAAEPKNWQKLKPPVLIGKAETNLATGNNKLQETKESIIWPKYKLGQYIGQIHEFGWIVD